MAITDTDLVEYLSADAGSTGGAISGSSVTSGVTNNVWLDVTDASRVAGTVVYRKTFWKNINGTSQEAAMPVMFVPTLPTYATLEIGLGVDSADDNDPAQGNMVAWATADWAVLSADWTDTRTATIYGLDNSLSPIAVAETIALSSGGPVTSSTIFTKVYGVFLSGTDPDASITVTPDGGGGVRGTIGPGKIGCWLWISGPTTKSAGIHLPNLSASANYGMWRKLTVTAGQGSERPCTPVFRIEEGA